MTTAHLGGFLLDGSDVAADSFNIRRLTPMALYGSAPSARFLECE
jgi:hypothetical protein